MADDKDSSKNFVFGKGGMKTKVWGPKLWDSLFIMVSGAYPVVFSKENPVHVKTLRAFKSTLEGLVYTLPCSFCRESFKTFIKETPLACYTGGRKDMMLWLYTMKDKVNKKLLIQEKMIKNCKFKTIPSPEFEKILRKYEKYRARCSDKLLRCV